MQKVDAPHKQPRCAARVTVMRRTNSDDAPHEEVMPV